MVKYETNKIICFDFNDLFSASNTKLRERRGGYFSHVIKGNLRKCHKIHFNSRGFFLSPLIGGEVGKPWYDYIWSSLFVCVEINIMTKIRISIHVGGNIKKLQFQTALFWHFFVGESLFHIPNLCENSIKKRGIFLIASLFSSSDMNSEHIQFSPMQFTAPLLIKADIPVAV